MKFPRLTASLLLALAIEVPSGLLSPAAASPGMTSPLIGRHGPVEVHHRAAWEAPYLLLGPLSPLAPSDAPGQVTARFLEQVRGAPDTAALCPRDLGAAEIARVGNGHVVRLPQRHRGVPVLGGDVILRLSRDGQVVRVLSAVLAQTELDAIDVSPTVSAAQAAERVRGAGGTVSAAPLLYIDRGTRRLVWAIPSVDAAARENTLYLIDAHGAHGGEILRRIDRVWTFDQFRVYRANPVTGPSPTTVSLASGMGGPFSPAAGAPRYLSSALLKGMNCIDQGTTRQILGLTRHACVPQQVAAADGTNDFASYTPLVNGTDGMCPTSGSANQNPFAEQHMYWHAAAIYARFRQLYACLGEADFKLGLSTGMGATPLPLVVNLCQPDPASPADVKVPLLPLVNALYFPPTSMSYTQALGGQSSEYIGFGLGPKANFAMDGDVVYHEFTHAVINTRGKLPFRTYEDSLGMNDDGGAINEGLADFFSSALAGDANVGEYAAENFGFPAGAGVRSLTNTDQCADQRIGEIHADSTPFSGALWEARVNLTGDPKDPGSDAAGRRDAFDQAVLAALQGTDMYPTMTAVALLVVQEVAMRAVVLGSAAKKLTTQAFTAHGILPGCDRTIKVLSAKPLLCLDGVETRGGSTLIPGYVQWRIDMPVTADTLRVDLTSAASGGCPNLTNAGRPGAILKLAVRTGDAPITWAADTGMYDRLFDLQPAGSKWSVELPMPKGVSRIMLVNAGGSTQGQNITLSFHCAAADGCHGPPDLGMLPSDMQVPSPDLGMPPTPPLPPIDAALSGPPPPPPAGGCSAGGAGRPGAPVDVAGCVGLLVLLLLIRRESAATSAARPPGRAAPPRPGSRAGPR